MYILFTSRLVSLGPLVNKAVPNYIPNKTMYVASCPVFLLSYVKNQAHSTWPWEVCEGKEPLYTTDMKLCWLHANLQEHAISKGYNTSQLRGFLFRQLKNKDRKKVSNRQRKSAHSESRTWCIGYMLCFVEDEMATCVNWDNTPMQIYTILYLYYSLYIFHIDGH